MTACSKITPIPQAAFRRGGSAENSLSDKTHWHNADSCPERVLAIMLKTLLIVSSLLLPSFAVNAQAIYYCTKDGKKIISDKSCDEQGAQHKRAVTYDSLPPLNTSQGLTASQIEQGKQIDQRNRQQAQVDEQQRQVAQQQAVIQQQQNKARCASLEAEKQRIITAQRAPNSGQMLDYYRDQLKKVNDEMYSLRCETL